MIQKTQLTIQNSYVKTEHSFVTHKQPYDKSQHNEKIQQFQNVCRWINSMLTNCNLSTKQQQVKQNQNDTKPAYGYFLMKLDSISDVPFKRVHRQSKVYIQIVCQLFNARSNRQYGKVCRIVRQLIQINNYLFQLKQPLCLYCYSSCEQDLLLRVQILLCQKYIRGQDSVSTFSSLENIGFCEIDFTKQKKIREKKMILGPNEYLSNQKVENEHSAHGHLFYNLYKSDSYRYLERIIPQNFLCDSNDRIPGILGYHLPLSQNTLTQFSITPQAKGLDLNLMHIQLAQITLKDAYHKAQFLIKQRYSVMKKLQINSAQVLLSSSFHNGWKIVSSAGTALKQKGQIRLKTNNSNTQQWQNIKKKKQTGFKNHKKTNSAVLKHYEPQNSLQLKLAFPQQQFCAVIFQVSVNFQVRFQIQDKKDQLQIINQDLVIPLCFSIVSAKSLANFKILNSIFYPGSCLNSVSNVKDMYAKNIRQLKQLSVSKQTKNMASLRNPSILLMQTQNNKQARKLTQNFSQTSLTNLGDVEKIGYMQFQVKFIESQDLGRIVDQNNSLLLQNLSTINISKGDIKDKINTEKQRILRETKKTIQKNKKLGIQFLKEIYISDRFQQEQQRNTTKMKQGLLLYKKEQIIGIFKQKIKRSNYQNTFQKLLDFKKGELVQYKDKIISLHNNNRHSNYKPFKDLQQVKKLYRIEINQQCAANHHIYQQFSKYYYLMFSNYRLNSDNFYRYDQISPEILKTELSQINFNNCFFFHFLHFNNINNQVIRLPKVFFFVFKFYNQAQIRSQLMTVNKDTGEIYSYDPTKDNMKIMHVQIDIDKQAENYALNYIHFIQYLYNGLLNIQIIDYSSSLSYGHFYLPLRNLIRKRKNQVVVCFQDFVYHRNKMRAILKVQARSIRKNKTKSVKPLQDKPKVQILPQQKNQKSKLFQQIKPAKEHNKGKIKNQQPKMAQSFQLIQQTKQTMKFLQKQKAQDNRLDRIARFKENKYRKQSKLKLNQEEGGQSQILNSILKEQIVNREHQSYKITRLLHEKYLQEVKILKVCYLKKQFMFLQIYNKYENKQSFTLKINDKDQKWLVSNPANVSKELVFIRDISLLEKEDLNVLNSVKKYQDMLSKTLNFDEQERIVLESRTKGYILLCYQTLRKYRSRQFQPGDQSLSTLYNTQRIITCSLINYYNDNIQTIYSLQIVPMPQQSTIQLQYYRPINQKSTLSLPFIDPNSIISETDCIFSSNPHIIISKAKQVDQDSLLSKLSLLSKQGIQIQITNSQIQSFPIEFNLLVFNNTKQKNRMLLEEENDQKSKNKIKNTKNSRMQIYNEKKRIKGPQTISLQIKIWGCQKISLKGELWIEKEGTIELQKNILKKVSNGHLESFYLLCDDEQSLTFYKNDKKKQDFQQIYSFSENLSKITSKYSLFSQRLGKYYINVHAIFIGGIKQQKQLLQKQIFKQVQPFLRLVIQVQSQVPSFKQILKININRLSQHTTIEQPFAYKNVFNKKMNYKILTNDEKIMWVKSSEMSFSLENKVQKKFSVFFNIQRILQRYEFTGQCQSVIMGIKWAKGIDYFCFKFNIF